MSAEGDFAARVAALTDEWQAAARRARQLLGISETVRAGSELPPPEVRVQVQESFDLANAIADLLGEGAEVIPPSAEAVAAAYGLPAGGLPPSVQVVENRDHFVGCDWPYNGRCSCAEILAAHAVPVAGLDFGELSAHDDPAVRLLTEGADVPEAPKKLTLAEARRKIAALEAELTAAREQARVRDSQLQNFSGRVGRGDRCEETLREVLRLFQPDTAGFLKSVYVSLADYNAWCELVRLPRRDDDAA